MRLDSRKRDVTDSLEKAGAVDIAGLVQGLVDVFESGGKNDEVSSDSAPKAEKPDQHPDHRRVAQPVDVDVEECVDESRVAGEHPDQNQPGRRQREDSRQINARPEKFVSERLRVD